MLHRSAPPPRYGPRRAWGRRWRAVRARARGGSSYSLRNCAGVRHTLLELDAVLPDYFFPARQVFADLRRKLLRGVAHRLDAGHAVALLLDPVGETRRGVGRQ